MTLSPARARLYQLWSRLGAGPYTPGDLEKALLALLNGVGHEADASALLDELCDARVVVPTKSEDGVVRLRKAEKFPELPEAAVPGTTAFDRQNAEASQRERADADRADEQTWRASPQRRQREETVALIREVVREEHADLERRLAEQERRYLELEARYRNLAREAERRGELRERARGRSNGQEAAA